MSIRICSFDIGLPDLPKRLQRDTNHVASLVAKAGRFSAFDATATPDLCKTMDRIERLGWFECDRESSPYPWITAILTEAGRAALRRSE